KNFSFERECNQKYRELLDRKNSYHLTFFCRFLKNSKVVFEAINSSFDHLPLVGIIDESVFCAHGGIPRSARTLSQLFKIPAPLKYPERQSPAAWEVSRSRSFHTMRI